MRIFGAFLPPSLYLRCLKSVVKIFESVVQNFDDQSAIQITSEILHRIGNQIALDVMTVAFLEDSWSEIGTLFSYCKLSRIICEWNVELLARIRRQKTAKQIFILNVPRQIRAHDIIEQTADYASVDFDGELYWRDEPQRVPCLRKVFENDDDESWLSSSENIIRILRSINEKTPKYLYADRYDLKNTIQELHLGVTNVSVDDICILLRTLPSLFVLRSYKLVKALYQLHSQEWRAGKPLPKYRLRNMDADFSYVGRCTLAIEPMLPMDALQLAVNLCPKANSVRVRIDCSTHHDILLPLTDLKKLKEISVVCVTNGERSLLDYADIEPVLLRHGSEHLKFLELKAIDEVDIHKLVHICPKLDTLVLSSNDYVTPKCSALCYPNRVTKLPSLKTLFFAEGGDIVSNSNVPSCFWYTTLIPSEGTSSKITALFLESPRISEAMADIIYNVDELRWPQLQILSICDYNELSVDHLASLTRAPSFRYLRVSQCQKLGVQAIRRWQALSNRYDVLVHHN